MVSLLLLAASHAGAIDFMTPAGVWLAHDDDGQPTGYIKIIEHQGIYTGYIKKGLPTDKIEEVCTACKDERKNQKLIGMVMMKNVRAAGDVFMGDEILDPFSGNTYRVKLTMIDRQKMEVRGFIGVSLLGRTQVWERIENDE